MSVLNSPFQLKFSYLIFKSVALSSSHSIILLLSSFSLFLLYNLSLDCLVRAENSIRQLLTIQYIFIVHLLSANKIEALPYWLHLHPAA